MTTKDESQNGSEQTVVIRNDALKRFAGGFTSLPNVVLRNADLSIGAKTTYCMLLSYAWQDDFSFPAQETLARHLASGDRSVRRWLTELKEQGFITWKQRGLNRPNVYYILELPTAGRDGALVSESAGPAKLASLERRVIRTGQNGQAGPADMAAHDRSIRPTTNTQRKKTQTKTHTGEGVNSPPSRDQKTLALIERFHAENGRATEGRKPNRRELEFAGNLISDHGFEKASHVVSFGLERARETNFPAQYFQAYEGYVPDALRDFGKREKLATARKALAEKQEKERRKEVADQRQHFSRPVEDRVAQSLRSWVQITEKIKFRKPSAEEIAEKRDWYRDAETKNEELFHQEHGQATRAETG